MLDVPHDVDKRRRRPAHEGLAEILGPAPMAPTTFRDGTHMTGRWTHRPMHDYLPAMTGHIIGAAHGGDGEVVMTHEGRRTHGRIRAGVVCIVPEGQDGHWHVSGPVHGSHVFLSDARLLACAEQIAPGRRINLLGRVTVHDPGVFRILEMISTESLLDDPASQLFVEQALDLLCTQLLRNHSDYRPVATPSMPQGLANWQLRRVQEYMQAHLQGVVTLDDLAATVGLSRHYFCTSFRLATGMTPHDYLTTMRMARAMQLMAQHELSVTAIALAVGYQTTSAFTARFRRATGRTPSAYRRQL